MVQFLIHFLPVVLCCIALNLKHNDYVKYIWERLNTTYYIPTHDLWETVSRVIVFYFLLYPEEMFINLVFQKKKMTKGSIWTILLYTAKYRMTTLWKG